MIKKKMMKINSYKASLYNIIVQKEKEFVYIWNTRSNSIVKLESLLYKHIINKEYNEPLFMNNVEGLLSQGIIVDNNLNEFNELLYKQKEFQTIGNKEVLSLTIAPTMECNYKCTYCFEENKPKGRMSDETIKCIVKFVQKYFTEHGVKKLIIHWFGGEPLISYNVIESLSEKLINLCKINKVEYIAHIVTNGFYLTSEKIDCLINKYHVKSFQISFEGNKQIYCKYKNTTPQAYNCVKRNLFELINKKPKNVKVNIRINIDKNNIENVDAFINELKNDKRFISENVVFSFGRIFGNCKECFSFLEFEQIREKYNYLNNSETFLPESKLTYCMQYLNNSFCVDYKGNLFKCEHDFGKEDRIVGNILNGLYYNDFFMNFMNRKVPEKCKLCRLYPICLGGCPNDSLNKKAIDCEYSEEQLINKVKKYIKKERSNGDN